MSTETVNTEHQISEAERQELIFKQAARLERQRRDALRHPLGLYKFCFKADDGGDVDITWYHLEWVELFFHNSSVMIEAARGTSKTTWVLALVLWLLGHNQNLRIKIICGNETNAKKRLAAIRSHIRSNELYKTVFPAVVEDKKEQNDATTLNLVRDRHGKDATIEAKGVLSDGTGDRADLLIFDDACNYKNSVQEPSTRPRVLEKIRGDWFQTLIPGGKKIFIFTPWHKEDAHAILKKENCGGSGEWAYKKYAHGRPGDPYFSLWPKVFPREVLEKLRGEEGAIEYARSRLCKAMADDAQIVRPEFLRCYTRYDMTPRALDGMTAILSLDPSGGREAKKAGDPDFLGVSILLVEHPAEGRDDIRRPKAPFRVYVPDVFQTRCTTAAARDLAVHLAHQWASEYLPTEAQGASTLHDWIYEKDPRLYVIPIPASISKQARLQSITPWLEDDRMIVLFHPKVIEPNPQPQVVTLKGYSYTIERPLRGQLLDFPLSHDDALDSFVQGLRYIRHYLLPLEADEDEARPNPNTPSVDVEVMVL